MLRGWPKGWPGPDHALVRPRPSRPLLLLLCKSVSWLSSRIKCLVIGVLLCCCEPFRCLHRVRSLQSGVDRTPRSLSLATDLGTSTTGTRHRVPQFPPSRFSLSLSACHCTNVSSSPSDNLSVANHRGSEASRAGKRCPRGGDTQPPPRGSPSLAGQQAGARSGTGRRGRRHLR